MARRRVSDFDRLLDAWARWLADDRCSFGGGGGSLLARWMDAKGHLIFGGSSGPRGPVDTVEARIEAAVYDLGQEHPLRADVLRLEYAAGWQEVAQRRALIDYDPRHLTQLGNALHLGVSVRTYRMRLAEARAYVQQRLGSKA